MKHWSALLFLVSACVDDLPPPIREGSCVDTIRHEYVSNLSNGSKACVWGGYYWNCFQEGNPSYWRCTEHGKVPQQAEMSQGK